MIAAVPGPIVKTTAAMCSQRIALSPKDML
jgi:hypothetical protein